MGRGRKETCKSYGLSSYVEGGGRSGPTTFIYPQYTLTSNFNSYFKPNYMLDRIEFAKKKLIKKTELYFKLIRYF